MDVRNALAPFSRTINFIKEPTISHTISQSKFRRFLSRFHVKSCLAALAGFAVIALLWTLPAIRHEIYYHERNVIASLIAETPAIRVASYGGFDDGLWENIVVTTIELKNRPSAFLRLCRLEDHEKGVFRHLHLQQIGDLILYVGGLRNREHRNGKPVNSTLCDWWRVDVDIGPDSEFKEILPFSVSTLDELFERYDEISAYFATWPTSDSPGEIELLDGSKRYYYVVRRE